MKLLFKQRLFSWLDSYDIYYEDGSVAYTVQGQLSWGHCLKIFDPQGFEVGTVKEKVLTWMPKFEIYLGEQYIGSISKEFTVFKPKYNIDFNGWHIDGNWTEWDYTILGPMGDRLAVISKEIWNCTDTYIIDVMSPDDGLYALMFVLAIDAEKCSRD